MAWYHLALEYRDNKAPFFAAIMDIRYKIGHVRYGLLLLTVWLSGVIAPAQVMSDNTITAETLPFTTKPICSGRFVARDLDHTTTVAGGNRVRMFEANGGGVAVNDLDNDGDLDIVLTNQAGMNTILWNDGNLN